MAVAPALFEEANRLRAFTVAICRLLGDCGIASILPDLPGQGDSLLPTDHVTLADLRAAFAAAATGAHAVISLRAGALLDPPGLPAWRLSPLTGVDLTRELTRLQVAGGDPETFGGHRLSPALLHELTAAPDPAPARTVRLATDPRPADRILSGPPLWRRSEPGTDADLAAAIAEDIARWLPAA